MIVEPKTTSNHNKHQQNDINLNNDNKQQICFIKYAEMKIAHYLQLNQI